MLSEIVFAISAMGAAMSAMGAVLFAYWRYRTADRNLRHQQYLTGSELLSQQVDNRGQRYTNRVVGIVTLARLMEEDPDQYDDKVVTAFEIFLSSPPVFSVDIEGHHKHETDYESRDTVQVIRALRKRSSKRKEKNPPRLWPNNGPFIIQDGDIISNPSHNHYKRWLEVKGRDPNF